MNKKCDKDTLKTKSLYPPPPWYPANAPENPVTQRVIAEADTWVNLEAVSELSEEPLFVRVLKTGTVTSIQGRFPGNDPLAIFWRILEVGGMEPRPEEWEVLGEGQHEDERFSTLRLQRHNCQGLPLAGGTVTLVYDSTALYAVEGRLAGPLPEVEIGPVTKEELQERRPEFNVEGPFLSMPAVMWVPFVALPREPLVIFALFGPESAQYVDSYGNVLYSCDPPSDTPEIVRKFYHDYIYRAEFLLACIHRPLLVVWMDMVYFMSKSYLDPYGPYYDEIVIYGGKGESPRHLGGWTPSFWNGLYAAMSSLNYGCGSRYVREPKVVYNSKGEAGYEKDEALTIWFEHLAVMFWFEAICKPAWKIGNLSKEGRLTLWDMSKTYDKHSVFNEGVYCYDEKLIGWGASYRPFAEFLLLQQLRIIDRNSADKTVENLVQYVRRYFKHADDRLAIAVKVWGREFNVEHVLVFSYRDAQDGFHVTRGCHHTSAFMCSLLRQISIPCTNQIIELEPKGEHSRILFTESQKTVFHSDDFYMGRGRMQVDHKELLPGPHNAPGNQLFAVPTRDLLVDEQVVRTTFYKSFTKECNGVTRRTNGGKKTTPGCNTADEARMAEVRRQDCFFKSWIWISWLDLYFLFQRNLDEFLIHSESDQYWPYFKPGNTANYSEDFTLEQREKVICEVLRIVHVHGLQALLKVPWLQATAVGTDVKNGKPHQLKSPPGCPYQIP